MKSFSKLFKAFAATVCIGGACAALTSCKPADTSHTIVFYHTMGDSLQTVLNTAVERFEKKFPGWKIDHSQVGGYDDVRDTIVGDLQGDMQPNLAYCYADHVAQYIQTGKVIDLTKYINSTETITVTLDDGSTKEELVGYTAEEIADFVPGYYNEGKATNYADYADYGYASTAMFTLPYVKSTEVLYYNEDALIAAGITERVDGKTVAKVPATWDDLWDACEKLVERYPNCTPLGYDSESNWFITMCEQNGWGYTAAQGDHYLFNNTNTVSWLETLKTNYDKKYFTTQTQYGSYTSNLFVKGAEEGSVFSIGSSGGASHQASDAFKWGVAPIPGSKLSDGTVNRKVISQGPSLCMLTQGNEEKDLMAWEFMKLLMDPTFQASFSMTSGYNPSRESTFDIPEYAEFLEGDSIVAVTANVAKTMSDDYFTSPAFIGSSTARTQVGSALVYAFSGQKSAADALADAAKKCGA